MFAVSVGHSLRAEQRQEQLLKNSEIQQAREKYTDSLRDKAQVSILLQPPSVQVGYDPARVKGSADAPVTIVEFSDFQCPFCGKVQPALQAVLDKYKGKVKLAYRDFPLSQIHQQAEMAAEASRCALAQGKYWEMHDAMFADQAKLDAAALVKTAAGLGMDQNSFESCLKSGKYSAVVQQDVEAGSQAGVNATPTFFSTANLWVARSRRRNLGRSLTPSWPSSASDIQRSDPACAKTFGKRWAPYPWVVILKA